VAQSPVTVEPVHPGFDAAVVDDLGRRLSAARLAPGGGTSWERGVPRHWLAGLLADWRRFDTGAFAARLDQFAHVRAVVGGQAIHLVHQHGRGPAPLPLLLTHGWPGSFCEYLDLVPLLTDPGAHGGDPGDAFTVVTEGLRYPRYTAHGSDLGAGVTARLARAHPDAVAGIHLATPGLAAPPRPWSPAEEAHFAQVDAWTGEEGGYAHQHSTKPATLGAALQDSPAGLAAWIGEKITAWSSTTADGQPAFPRDLLLGTLTLYWVTGTITSSLLPYWAYRHAPGTALPAGEPAPVPTAITIFGGEKVPFPKPPRELAERYFTVTTWAEHDRGGHFPAVAEPQLLAETLRDAFRPLRS